MTLNVTVGAGTEGTTLTNCAAIESDETEPAEACEDTQVCTAEPTPTPTPYPTPYYPPGPHKLVPALTPTWHDAYDRAAVVGGWVCDIEKKEVIQYNEEKCDLICISPNLFFASLLVIDVRGRVRSVNGSSPGMFRRLRIHWRVISRCSSSDRDAREA